VAHCDGEGEGEGLMYTHQDIDNFFNSDSNIHNVKLSIEEHDKKCKNIFRGDLTSGEGEGEKLMYTHQDIDHCLKSDSKIHNTKSSNPKKCKNIFRGDLVYITLIGPFFVGASLKKVKNDTCSLFKKASDGIWEV